MSSFKTLFRILPFLLPIAGLVHAAPATDSSPAETRVFNVKAFGALGDGKTLDSDSINRAILAAAATGGGTVTFPPGNYLSASIRLKSNISLYLEAGAIIQAVDDKIAPYDQPEPNDWGDKLHYQDWGHSHWHNSLIWGVGLENVSILGPGLIHGQGLNNGFNRFADETKGEKRYKDGGAGAGNKAIALRDCRNVILRDFSILHGGHFGILATGVKNLTIDNLKIDTNRDGMDIDGCQNVRVTQCSVNSPWDDGICLKASYGLGHLSHCDNITISDCYVAGSFDEGTLLDGTFKVSTPEYRSYHTGRIKLGTESNGDFKNIVITNCVFDGCRGLAIESVDGSHIEDVAVSNLTLRHVSGAPIFIRLGSRLRGPEHTEVGTIKRININNVVISDADWKLGNIISGIPGHPVEDVRISNLREMQQGGGTADLGARVPPEEAAKYPEPEMFGTMPSYAFFIRHVTGITVSAAKLDFAQPEARPAFVLEDVQEAAFDHLNIKPGTSPAPWFDLRGVTDFTLQAVKNQTDVHFDGSVRKKI